MKSHLTVPLIQFRLQILHKGHDLQLLSSVISPVKRDE